MTLPVRDNPGTYDRIYHNLHTPLPKRSKFFIQFNPTNFTVKHLYENSRVDKNGPRTNDASREYETVAIS
jgi:hypothetical protein